MSIKVIVFLAEGFEETEAIAPIDFMRRSNFDVRTISVGNALSVTGAHDVTIIADEQIPTNLGEYDLIMLPGGMPGTNNLWASEFVKEELNKAYKAGKWLAAICAAPIIFGRLGFLDGRKAICYPGFEADLNTATLVQEPVVVDGKIITAKGAGASMQFGYEIVKAIAGKEIADDTANKMIMKL